MTEDNKDQYGRKDEKLKIYRIPLNFKKDASGLSKDCMGHRDLDCRRSNTSDS